MTQKNISDQLRNRFTADLAEFLAAKYDVDVCKTAAGKLMEGGLWAGITVAALAVAVTAAVIVLVARKDNQQSEN